MGERIVIKAAKWIGILYIMLSVILLIFLQAAASAGGDAGLALLSIIIPIFCVIIGVWFLIADLIVFESDKVTIKLSMFGKRNVISFNDISLVDTSKSGKIILTAGGNKIKIILSLFSSSDKEKIRAGLKK